MISELETSTNVTDNQLPNPALEESTDAIPVSESLHYDGRHYDLLYGNYLPVLNLSDSDRHFWLDMAKQYGGPILELCCGSGRISAPLAEKGYQVTGIDISESMLLEARKKSSQVEWIQSDISNFELNKKFPLILLATNAIIHILEIEKMEALLNCVKKHLTPDGVVIIDISNDYQKENLQHASSKRSLLAVYPDPDGKGTVAVTGTHELDTITQICNYKIYFRFLEQKKEYVDEGNWRIYHPNELDALLKYNGFAIKSRFGDYDQQPFSPQSPNYILVCKLKA